MKQPLVQILVVVANTQARTLRAEVEKGFARTAFGRKLVSPKGSAKADGPVQPSPPAMD